MEIASGILIRERYRLERLIGQGGMGVVWAAEDVVAHAPVALKFLQDGTGDPDAAKRLLREARAASAVCHPNVVQVLEVLELQDGSPVLVMELLTGESLRELLQRTPRLPLRELAEIMVPVVSAVSAAHALGIVHRDLKPENIFVSRSATGDRVVKILDFGIAKLTALDDAAMRSTGNTTGAVLGTPTYMAPEQVFGERDVDHRADIWALGLILYQCLSGVLPTEGGNVGQVLKNVLSRPFAPLAQLVPDLPVAISRLVAHMLERERSHRLADLHEVLQALSPFTRGHRGAAVLQVLAPVARRRRGAVKSRAVRSGALLGIPAVAALGFAAARWYSPAPDPPGSCPNGMVQVPAGTFQMGSPSGEGDPNEHPQHEVELSGYCIDKTEVTVEEFHACVNTGTCTPPHRVALRCNGPDRPDHPVTCVDWDQAAAYCQWKDKRLPTEAEWEYAARGSDGRGYPWGSEAPAPNDIRLRVNARSTAPVGHYPDGASPFGVLDMAGNVWEWTADWYGPYSAARTTNPQGPQRGEYHVVRGGGWGVAWKGKKSTTMRSWGQPTNLNIYLGFRCARGG